MIVSDCPSGGQVPQTLIESEMSLLEMNPFESCILQIYKNVEINSKHFPGTNSSVRVAENRALHWALGQGSRRQCSWDRAGEGARERWAGCWGLALGVSHVGPDLKRNRSCLLVRMLSWEVTVAAEAGGTSGY